MPSRPAALPASPEKLLPLLRRLHADGNDVLATVLLVQMAGGAAEARRLATLRDVGATLQREGHLMRLGFARVDTIAKAVVAELGMDPRTEDAGPRGTVPPALSVRAALLAGDSAALWDTVSRALAVGFVWSAAPA